MEAWGLHLQAGATTLWAAMAVTCGGGDNSGGEPYAGAPYAGPRWVRVEPGSFATRYPDTVSMTVGVVASARVIATDNESWLIDGGWNIEELYFGASDWQGVEDFLVALGIADSDDDGEAIVQPLEAWLWFNVLRQLEAAALKPMTRLPVPVYDLPANMVSVLSLAGFQPMTLIEPMVFEHTEAALEDHLRFSGQLVIDSVTD